MKKIILILLILFTSNIVFSQSAYYKKVSVKDSLYSAAGTLRINANAYYLDGVLQSFGGGSPFDLTAFHLWSGINRFTDGTYFTDSVKFTGIVIVDSIKGNGSGLTNVDAITLKGQDTTHFAHTDTLTTETNKAINWFTNIVIFALSPTVSAFYQDASRTKLFYLPQSASDTLATISQTQTITNKTISGASNTITGIKSGMAVINQLVFTPADATTYYFGGNSTLTPQTAEGQRRIYFPVACTIKSVIISTYTTGTPSSEAVSLYIRKNATTDSTISTSGAWAVANGYNVISKYNMGVVIAQGDFIEFKLITPTWATNPTQAYINVTFYWE